MLADGLLSYAGPQGLRRGPELDLTDRLYDGREEGGQLAGGLGQLVDGQKGQDNFRLDLAGHGKGKAAIPRPDLHLYWPSVQCVRSRFMSVFCRRLHVCLLLDDAPK